MTHNLSNSLRSVVTCYLFAMTIASCSTEPETQPENTIAKLQLSGTVRNVPPEGLPSGMRIMTVWEARDPTEGDILILGRAGTLDLMTGAFAMEFEGELPAKYRYYSAGYDAAAVGFVTLVADSTLVEGTDMTETSSAQWDRMVAGAADPEAIIYRVGDASRLARGGFAGFRSGYSLAETIFTTNKSEQMDYFKPTTGNSIRIAFREPYRLADWH